MGSYSFNSDLNLGQTGEKHVALDLISEGSTFIKYNNDKYYDLMMLMPNGKELLFEVKTDDYCKPGNDTGNIFIEFECRNNQSGINVTKSDYFVYYYIHLGEMWYIKTNNLKKLISENNFRRTEFSGDKGSNTKGYLIPKKRFIKFFNVRKVMFNG